jgi:hypothetical protein
MIISTNELVKKFVNTKFFIFERFLLDVENINFFFNDEEA